ncbi:MAG: hypothetical protein MMC33_002384 [Icmadophila ericetorum]|nr:hypothetical protein [Icmadophila ericetorum]
MATIEQTTSIRFLKLWERLGCQKISGLNCGTLIGYATIALTINPDLVTRSSVETPLLQMALKQTKLKVFESTLAKKTLFDENRRASGVLVAAKVSENIHSP